MHGRSVQNYILYAHWNANLCVYFLFFSYLTLASTQSIQNYCSISKWDKRLHHLWVISHLLVTLNLAFFIGEIEEAYFLFKWSRHHFLKFIHTVFCVFHDVRIIVCTPTWFSTPEHVKCEREQTNNKTEDSRIRRTPNV